MPTTNVLQVALNYANRGWSVVPLLGKSPRVRWQTYQNERATADEIAAWWADWPDAGIGILLGPVSGVVRVDADGPEAVEQLSELFGELPQTPQFVTPSGGLGWLFAYQDGIDSEILWRGRGEHEELRLMSGGTMTVLPPSPHPDGGYYEWVDSPWDVQVAELPAKVHDVLRSRRAEKVLRTLEAELRVDVETPDRALLQEAVDNLPADYVDGYDTWLQVGMALHSAGADLLPMWDSWSRKSQKYEEGVCAKRWASFRPDGGLTGRSIVHWAKQTGWQPPRSDEIELTDVGNAARIAARFGDRMLFCHQWEKWLVWDGAKWAVDCAGSAVKLAEESAGEMFKTASLMYAKATDLSAVGGDEVAGNKIRAIAAKLYAWTVKSRSNRAISAALSLVQHRLPVQPHQLDTDPWVLNCANGTVDLRTGELLAHDRTRRLTKVCPTEYREESCPRWDQFLLEVFAGNEETVHWMQKLLGYCVTGDVSEHVLPIFWGAGANGKTTMLMALFRVLGPDYTCKAPRDLIVATRNRGHPTEFADLFGRRLVAAVETADGARLDEVTVKEITGGDPIKCRRLYEDYWQFDPTHKIVLATNHQPEVRGTDHAVWRRIRLVPFTVTFDEASRDRNLIEKLVAEGPGILRWLIRGCMLWQKEGLGDAGQIRTATSEYRAQEDKLGSFLAECYDVDPASKVRTEELTRVYAQWCGKYNMRMLQGVQFGRAMTEKGFVLDPSRKYRLGLRVK
jgi:putative DNA primase/helicase